MISSWPNMFCLYGMEDYAVFDLTSVYTIVWHVLALWTRPLACLPSTHTYTHVYFSLEVFPRCIIVAWTAPERDGDSMLIVHRKLRRRYAACNPLKLGLHKVLSAWLAIMHLQQVDRNERAWNSYERDCMSTWTNDSEGTNDLGDIFLSIFLQKSLVAGLRLELMSRV